MGGGSIEDLGLVQGDRWGRPRHRWGWPVRVVDQGGSVRDVGLGGGSVEDLGMNASTLERIRFAAANRLCVDVGYEGDVQRVEPYSLRKARGGNVVSLSDLWAVDWPGRSVKWTKRRQHEWEAEGNYATPPSPFHRLLTFAQRPNGRGGPPPRPGEVLRGSGRAGTGLRSGPGCISGVSVHYRWDVASWVSMVNLVIRHD